MAPNVKEQCDLEESEDEGQQGGGDDPPILSSLLELKVPITDDVVRRYQSAAHRISMKGRKTKVESNWINDYVMNVHKLYEYESDEDDVRSVNSKARRQDLNAVGQPSGSRASSVIKLNELVKKPTSFDGHKPPARQWLDDYEKAAEANGWSENLKVKYFSTFLDKTANDWFVTIARRKVGLTPDWSDLRAAFIRNYLGGSDRLQLRRQIERTYQGEKEKVTSFIPRLLRLVELCDPYKDEDLLVELVRSKLRREYQNGLVLCDTYTIEALNDACLKIEAQMEFNRGEADNSRRKKKPYGPKFHRREAEGVTPNVGTKDQQRRADPDRPKGACFKCDEQGHISRFCKNKVKADGSPLNGWIEKKGGGRERPGPRTRVNAVTAEKDALTSNEERKEVVARIRAAGSATYVTNSIEVCNVLSKAPLIEHMVRCNGVELTAMFDTGSFPSIVNEAVATRCGWAVKDTTVRLSHAAGESLECVGMVEAELELKIRERSAATKYNLLVVRNLCSQVLIGLELMKIFKLTLNFEKQMPLSFQRATFQKGVRIRETTTIPARRVMLVEATIASTGCMVAVKSFHFDRSIMVANSIHNVVNNAITVAVMNIDTWDVVIKKNQQIASCETLDELATGSNRQHICSILALEDSDSHVNIGDQLEEEQVKQLLSLIRQHRHAFSVAGELGHTEQIEHRIELEENARPFREKARRHPYVHEEEARKQIAEMLERGIVSTSDSPWCSEYVMVKKKSGEWRMCVDFRRLNTLTRKDSYPLPHIEECLEHLAGQRYFSQMDFASGYWQLPVAKDSRKYTAFRVGGELYEFNMLPFGLTNAPATFQRLINALFAGLRGLRLQVFLDDVCLATPTWEEHLDLLKQVFGIIIKANLRLKPSKCYFGTERITFLGHEISADGLRPDPEKVRAIAELDEPLDVSGVKRVMGVFNYYRRFIPRFADIANPIVKLTRKEVTFQWGPEQEKAFATMKKELATCVTLTHLERAGPVTLKTDASFIGVAGILLQEQRQELRIVACVSRHLTPAEKNYTPMEIEALAVVYSLQKFRHYLLGRHFRIVTDHSALRVLNSRTTRNARVERWALALSEYDYEIVHQKGRLHEDVDCLSRSPVKELKESVSQCVLAMCALPLDTGEWKASYTDNESQDFLAKATARLDNFELKYGLIYKGNKLFVPVCQRDKMLRESHETPPAAHDGEDATISRLNSFWWPNLLMEVRDFVKKCDECQRRKVERRSGTGLLREHNSCTPMEVVAVDYVGPLPETLNRKKFVIIAIDHFTRFVEAKAVKDQTAERFVKFFTYFCGRFGIPKRLIADNAKQFNNKALDGVRELFGIQLQTSPAGHSQGNAICERAIQSMSDKLASIINNASHRLDWEAALPVVTFSMNSKTHSTTGYAPFELLYGRPPPLIQGNMTRASPTAYDLHAEVVKLALEKVHANAIALSYDRHVQSKERYDRSKRQREFDTDEQVLIKVKSRSTKLGNKFEGPYKVISKKNDIYDLECIANPRDKRRRHISQMKRFLTAAIVLLLLLKLVAAGQPLQEALPIAWEEDNDHFVSAAEETLVYTFHYISPCKLILDYAAMTKPTRNGMAINQISPNGPQNGGFGNVGPGPPPQPPIALQPQGQPNRPTLINQQPVGVPSGVQLHPVLQQTIAQPRPGPSVGGNAGPPVGQDILEEYYTVDDKKGQWVNEAEAKKIGYRPRNSRQAAGIDNAAVSLHRECEQAFNKTILATISKVNGQPRPRRQAGILAFACGYVISNVVDEVKRAWKGSTEDPEWQREIQTSYKALSHRNSLLNTALKVANQNQKLIEQEVAEVRTELDRLPSLDALYAYIVAELQTEKQLLEQIIIGHQQRRTDTVLMSELFKTQTFDKIVARDIELTHIGRVDETTLQFKMLGHVRSNATKVFRVKEVSYFTDWTSTTAIRHEYVGKKLLIKNEEIDCVAAADEPSNGYVVDDCLSPQQRDPQLKLWRLTKIDLSKEVRHSEYVRVGDAFLISCWGNQIETSMNEAGPYEVDVCPTFTFVLNDTFSFKTSDRLVKHISKKERTHWEGNAVFDVADVHFENHLRGHEIISKQIDVIDNLTAEVDRMQNDMVVHQVANTKVTWKHVAYVGGSSTSLVLICLFCVCIYYRCGKSWKLPEFSKVWASDKSDIKREIELQVMRRMETTNDAIEVRVQREVSRQVQRNINNFMADNISMLTDIPQTDKRRRGRRLKNINIEEMS